MHMDIEYQTQSQTSQPIPTKSHNILIGKFRLEDKRCHLFINDTAISYTIEFTNQYIIPLSLNYSYQIKKKDDIWKLLISCSDRNIFLEFQTGQDISTWDYSLSKYIARSSTNDIFKKICRLGGGAIANVFLVSRNIDHRLFAAKQFNKSKIRPSPIQRAKVEEEIRNMKKFTHPNIIKFQGIFQSEDAIYLVTEYIEGETLKSFLNTKKMPSPLQRQKIMKGILLGLAEMQKIGILHRDISPGNIMINKYGQVKIIDFGLSTDIGRQEYLLVKCGTPGYVAPEIVSIKDRSNVRLTTKSDVFSAGAIYYLMFFGKSLFQGKASQIIERTMEFDGGLPALQEFYCYQQYSLLEWMLDPNPEKRISASKALEYYFSKTESQYQE